MNSECAAIRQMADQDAHYDRNAEDDLDEYQRNQRTAVELAVCPEFAELGGMVLSNYDSPQQRGDNGKDDCKAHHVAFHARQVFQDQRLDITEEECGEEDTDDQIDSHRDEHRFQKMRPQALVMDSHRP